MNTEPKVSIIVAAYNNSKWIRGCLESCVNQTLKDIEIIIEDDGSTEPEAVAIIDEFSAADDRIILDRHENIGCGKSLNRALQLAHGTYIAEIDCDDQYETDGLEKLWNLSNNGTVDFVKGTYFALTPEADDPRFIELWPESLTSLGVFNPYELETLQYARFVCSTSCMWCGIYRREYILKYRIYWNETEGALYQDTAWSLLARVFAQSAIVKNVPVYRYNYCNDNNTTKKPFNFTALCQEYDYAERFLKGTVGLNVWPFVARARFGSCVWWLNQLDAETQARALIQFGQDMNKEVLLRELYDDEEWSQLMFLIGNVRAHWSEHSEAEIVNGSGLC